jgi:hypothetical protein
VPVGPLAQVHTQAMSLPSSTRDGRPAWSPRYLQWSGDSLSGLQTQKVIIWSASERQGGPTTFFELRSLVVALGYDAESFSVHSFVKRHFRGGALLKDMTDLGASDLDFRPSLQSHGASAQSPRRANERVPPGRELWLQKESFASTEVAFAALARWACSLHEPHAGNASNVLQDICNKLMSGLSSNTPGLQQLVALPTYAPRMCPGTPSSSVCRHCTTIVEGLPQDAMAMRAVLASFLVKLWDAFRKHRCAYAHLWFKHLLYTAAAVMNRQLLAGRWAQAPAGLKALRGKRRRLRVDDEVQWQGRASKQVRRQGGSADLSWVDAGEDQKKSLEGKACAAYVESTYEMLSGLKQFAVALDASTLSGEKMIFLAAYSAALHKGAWLVPQALGSPSDQVP